MQPDKSPYPPLLKGGMTKNPTDMPDNKLQQNPVTIESLDHEGRGIAHDDGKVIFIEGALTGERVTYSSYRKKTSYEQAQVGQILKQTFMRVQPKCAHFGVCGGCSMQHLEARAQVAAKQRVLEDNLERIGKVNAETMLPPSATKHSTVFSISPPQAEVGTTRSPNTPPNSSPASINGTPMPSSASHSPGRRPAIAPTSGTTITRSATPTRQRSSAG